MTKPAKPPVKFLLVDDLEDNLMVLEALLARDDLELLTARSGREALELLLNHDVALALLDVEMPEMDGFELAELMRGMERTRHVPIIFVTAGGHERHRVFKGYDAGAVDFLFKPIEPQILRHKSEIFFQLYRQRQTLQEALRLNEELMAVVGHDLRNPLNVVLLTASTLEATSRDPDVRVAAARLKSSGSRMVHIIDELFDFARARLGGGIPIEREPAHLGPIARKIVGELEMANPDRQVTLREAGDLEGRWDVGRLEQVISNLVGNAMRHGAPGSPITIELGEAGERAAISVHNAGHIPAEIVPRLFEPFQSGQGQSKRTRSEGLGLGLYIVQQIVHAHGGSVEVSSTEYEGTTFRLTLPRA